MELLIPQKYLLLLIATAVMILLWVIDFGITAARRKRRMKDYNQFVHSLYTCAGKETPALLLRIQNRYIQEYNEMGQQWLGHRLFRLKEYSEKGGKRAEINLQRR